MLSPMKTTSIYTGDVYITIPCEKSEGKYSEETTALRQDRQRRKFELFIESLRLSTLAVKPPKRSFLNISITEEFIVNGKPLEIKKNLPTRLISNSLLLNIIQSFYNDFDANLYTRYLGPNPTEEHKISVASKVFTPIIWARYKKEHRPYEIAKKRSIRQIKEDNRKAIEALKAQAYIKRQAKEQDQIRKMGDGDVEKGKRKFMERMAKQKKTKFEKVNEVSLSLEKEFLLWLESSEGKNFYKPMICVAPTQFSMYNWGYSEFLDRSSKINLKVKTIGGLNKALVKLSRHPKAKELKISGVVAWDVKDFYANPAAFTLINGNEYPTPLGGAYRLSQNEKIVIYGIAVNGDCTYVTTDKNSNAWKNFPKKFAKMEYKNQKITSKMKIMYSVTKSLDSIIVWRKCANSKIKKMIISVMYNGSDTVNPCVIFDDEKIAKLKRTTMNAIAILEEKERKKKHEARRKGMEQKKKKTLRKSDKKSERKSGKSVKNSYDKLSDIVNMYNTGLLTIEEFNVMKKQIINN